MNYVIEKFSFGKTFSIYIFGIILIYHLLVGAAMAHSNLQKSEKIDIYEGFGGDFTLRNTSDHNVSLKDYRGRVTVMFFGYTACPDNCPITLSVLKQVVVRLNKQADKLQVLFITIDPKKDTPEKMKNYLSAFQPNFIGLTGTKEEILKVAENYGSAFMKNPKSFDSELNYLMIHTGNIYLIDQSGKVNEVYSQDTKVEKIVHGIKKLLVSN